jgi:hypothetical protein
MRRTSGRLALVAVALAVITVLPAGAQQGVSTSPPPGALVAPGNPPDLTLLYTGDVIGYVDPCG